MWASFQTAFPFQNLQVEWWHNFHIRQQSPSLFQSYFPHESFNVGLLEMALLTELQGGNIDYESCKPSQVGWMGSWRVGGGGWWICMKKMFVSQDSSV